MIKCEITITDGFDLNCVAEQIKEAGGRVLGKDEYRKTLKTEIVKDTISSLTTLSSINKIQKI